jgi:hypothetical protein
MSKSDSKYGVKTRFFLDPTLSPIIAAFLTVVIFFWFLPLFSPWAVAYIAGDMPGGAAWNAQKEVVLYEQKEKYQVFALGGSQFLQGFPYRDDVITEYKKKYGEQIDFLEVGFSLQSISQSLLLLSQLPIDSNTLIFIHISPNRLNDNAVNGCNDSPLSLIYNEKYSNVVNSKYDLNCYFSKFRASISLFTDIAYKWIRAFVKGKDTPYRFDKFYTENEFLQNPNKFVKQFVRDRILQSELEGPTDNNNLTKNGGQKEFYKLVKDYVNSLGGTVVLLEMPFNENFLESNSAYAPGNHLDDMVVYNWLVDNNLNGGLFKLSKDYYEEVELLEIPMISMRNPMFYGQDFYDSMHMTHNGRKKFIPKFINILHDEIDKIKTGGSR